MTIDKLRNQISEYFSIRELQDLCFDLDIEYENLPGETLNEKVRELITYCYRHGQLEPLILRCSQLRPFLSWADIKEEADYPDLDSFRHSEVQKIKINIEQGDVQSFDADILALKFANDLFGADKAVADSLSKGRNDFFDTLPQIGDFQLIPSLGRIKADFVLFTNVGDLFAFEYEKIREFASKTLEILANNANTTVRHLAMTIHGINYGLDEAETLKAQLAGYLDALEDGKFPNSLEQITIVERLEDRVRRLQDILNNVIFENPIPVPKLQNVTSIQQTINRSPLTRIVGKESAKKPHVLVAMSNSDGNEELDDVYYYGIQEPVNALGYLCERANLSSNMNEAFTRVKSRIDTASIIIAELTGKNADVFLTLGYAWGRNRPTILLVNDKEEDLPFDIHNEHCLVYRRIRDLEKGLKQELDSLSR